MASPQQEAPKNDAETLGAYELISGILDAQFESGIPYLGTAIRTILEETADESLSHADIAGAVAELVSHEAIMPMPSTMESLGTSYLDVVQDIADGVDLDYVGLFGIASHNEDLFDSERDMQNVPSD